jgi:hypothetical protein
MQPRFYLLSVALASSFMSCLGLTYNYQQAVTIEGSGTLVEKVAFARGLLNVERYERLQRAAKAQFPALTPAQLDRLYLRWQVNKSLSGGQDSVVVIVGMATDGTIDARPIVLHCKELLERELRQELSHGRADTTRRSNDSAAAGSARQL